MAQVKEDTILLCILTDENGEEEARAYPWTFKDHECGEIYLTVFRDAFMHGTLDDFLRGYSAEIIKKFPELELEYREKPDLEYDNPMLQKAKTEAKNSVQIKPTKIYTFTNPELTFIHAFEARVFDHPEVMGYLGTESDWEMKLVNYIKRKVVVADNKICMS